MCIRDRDYEIISQEGNKITFVFTEANKNHEMPYVNVLVDFDETSSQATQTEQQTESTSSASVSETQETTTNATAEKNDNLNTVKIPVSYTHLDVYKRQIQACNNKRKRLPLLHILPKQNTRNHFNDERFKHTAQNNKTVYTKPFGRKFKKYFIL